MKISTIIITLNEERNIERCLMSVMEVSDEVIVIDSGSTDQTEHICKRYGVRFIPTTWKGYSATKNQGIELASFDYILSIDADECLDSTLVREINELKKHGASGIYRMNRLTNYCGHWVHHSGWNPDWKIRLFPKENIRWNNSIVHEELDYPDNQPIHNFTGRLHHYSYFSLEQHLDKANYYSELTAKKYAEQGRNASVLTPLISAVGRFFSMYFLKLGILDGWAGWHIARISAVSNAHKYRELRRLKKERA
jgi:glycosyltransferase involved in cell wall biosynthesis